MGKFPVFLGEFFPDFALSGFLASWLFGLCLFEVWAFWLAALFSWLLAFWFLGFSVSYLPCFCRWGGGCALPNPPPPVLCRAVAWLCDDLQRQT